MRALHITGPHRSDWHEVDIDPALRTLQRIVGGLVCAFYGRGFVGYANDDGFRMKLPPTLAFKTPPSPLRPMPVDVIVGHVIVFGHVAGDEDESDLTPAGRESFEDAYAPISEVHLWIRRN